MVEQNLALVRRWFEEVWNQKKVETVKELVAPECIWHGTSEVGDELRGPEGFLTLHSRLLDAFPDMHFILGDTFGSGEQVAVRWTATMKHSGDGLGMKASGANITLTGMGIARFSGGKIVETWDSWDKLGMMQQIQAATTAKSATNSQAT
jgi:steroid delta-isomerase-like uncharacterized protein